MLRITTVTSTAHAAQYYSRGDYYSADHSQEIIGRYHGKTAERLGLAGKEVTPDTFAALIENRHPETGEQLTMRTRQNRRCGYDFTFSVPKSASVLYAHTKDERILSAFRDSVNETMKEAEQEAEVRVRKGGAKNNRTSGNLLWAEFVHKTTRAIDGVPDQHLHVHSVLLNTSFDPVEKRYKAAEIGRLKGDANYYEAAAHARLAWKLKTTSATRSNAPAATMK